MTVILTYTNLEGRNTRDVLRRLSTPAMDRLRDEVNLIWHVMESEETQNDEEYSRIWNTPEKSLPKKTVIPNKKYAVQTPREYLEGFMEKINRQRGTDISPKQMDGFYNLHCWFANEFKVEEILFCDRDIILERTGSFNNLQPDCTIL